MYLAASLRRPDRRRIAPFVQSLLRLTGRAIGVPATVASVLTGFALAFVGGYSWTRSIWLVAAVALFTIAGAVWHWGLIPLRVRMGALVGAEEDAVADVPPEYEHLAKRWLSVNGAILALLGAILALMVWKPMLP